MSVEDEVMAEFRRAVYQMRGVVRGFQTWSALRNQPRTAPGGGLHEALRDSHRHEPVTFQRLDGPDAVRLATEEARSAREQPHAATGGVDPSQVQAFTGAGQRDPSESPRMPAGTATPAQAPTEAGHRTQQQRGGPTRPGLGV